jgi:hypothetical protein
MKYMYYRETLDFDITETAVLGKVTRLHAYSPIDTDVNSQTQYYVTFETEDGKTHTVSCSEKDFSLYHENATFTFFTDGKEYYAYSGTAERERIMPFWLMMLEVCMIAVTIVLFIVYCYLKVKKKRADN